MAYYLRLLRTALQETRKFWTLVRYWTFVAGAIVCPIGFQAIRHGWRSVLNLTETLESGFAGLIVSLTGTYLINIARGAKILDDERAETINSLRFELKDVKESQKIDPVEESRRSQIETLLRQFTDAEKAALRHLLLFGEVSMNDLAGAGFKEVAAPMKNKARTLLVEKQNMHGHYVYSVKPELKNALAFVLHQ